MRRIGLMVLATLVFTINDTLLKMATEALPPFESLFLRGVGASFWGVPLVVFTGNVRRVGGAFHPRVLLRNVCELIAVLCFIVALAKMPIADLSAIVQTAPIVLLVGVGLIYRERISPVQWLLILIGFSGTLMVAQPGGSAFSSYSLLGFGTAIMSAGRDILGRRVPVNIPSPVVAFGAILVVTFGAAVATGVFETWVWPQPVHLMMLAASGLFLMFGQLFIFLAYRTGDIGPIAPFFYSFTLWTLLSGALVFGTVPNRLAFAGMMIILASGVAVLLVSERQRRLKLLD